MSKQTAALRSIGGIVRSTADSGLPNIPAVPYSNDAGTINFLSAVKHWIERASGKFVTGGFGSSDTSALVTTQDLIDAGVLEVSDDGTFGPVRPPNAAIPPKPTNVTVSGAFTNMIVEWDDPQAAYGNHAYTEVWAAETDNFSVAALVGDASSFMFAHAVGEGSTRYYWVRFISNTGVKGPFQSVAGINGQTSPPVEFLMDTLSGSMGDQPYFDVPSATVIDGVNIPAGRYMKSAFILDGSITNAKIKNAAIDSAKIADLSVVRAKIASAAIGSAQIEDLSVYDAKIADAAITTAKIRNAAIVRAKIGYAAIGTAEIEDAAITNAKIGYAAIGEANIIDLSVDTLKLKNGAVTAAFAWTTVVYRGNALGIYLAGAIYGTPVTISVHLDWYYDWPAINWGAGWRAGDYTEGDMATWTFIFTGTYPQLMCWNNNAGVTIYGTYPKR